MLVPIAMTIARDTDCGIRRKKRAPKYPPTPSATTPTPASETAAAASPAAVQQAPLNGLALLWAIVRGWLRGLLGGRGA